MRDWAQQSALVVEDSTVQRQHMAKLLRSVGFGTVLEAWNGADALQLLEESKLTKVDLVLTDLDMPRMDGIELIHHLAERKLTDNLIVISARDPRLLELVENMGKEDADLNLLGTILKPLALDDLTLLLQRIGRSQHRKTADLLSCSEQEIREAIEQGQFQPFYQPTISLSNGLVYGVEALARWMHPELGVLTPKSFMGNIEGTELMRPFTVAIANMALGQLSHWRRIGLQNLKLSLNLSATILSDHVFVDRLAEMVGGHGIAAENIVWEVTETMMMDRLQHALANVARLRLKGFGLAMDDYGVGYSSMQQLSRCPFTELKIDRVFVDGASQRENRRVILESAIDMGHRLGVTTVAEGVESPTDLSLLRELGCDLAQGYLIAKPMAASELPHWIKDNRQRLRALGA